MVSIKRVILGIVASGISLMPLGATPVTWTLDDASPTSTGTAGITFADNTVLTGSFVFDSGNGASPVWTFSSASLTTSGGSIIPSGSWFVNANPSDCCADEGFLFLVSADPNTNPDLSALSGGAPQFPPPGPVERHDRCGRSDLNQYRGDDRLLFHRRVRCYQYLHWSRCSSSLPFRLAVDL